MEMFMKNVPVKLLLISFFLSVSFSNLASGSSVLEKQVYGKVSESAKKKNKPTFIVISKQEFRLWVFDTNSGEELATYEVSCGTGYGDKTVVGDKCTPEGVFHVYAVENPQKWTFDFKDGKGPVTGAYGPVFIRLDTKEFGSIGIHGSYFPFDLRGRNSSGCIRMRNEDVLELSKMVQHGTVVVITPSSLDVYNNLFK